MGLATNRTFNFSAIPTTYTNWAGKFVTLAEMQGVIEKGEYTDEELDGYITRLEVVCMLAKVQIKMKGIAQSQLGRLIYTDIDELTEEEKELLKIAGSLEKNSEHPLAEAIMERVEEDKIALEEVKER